MIHERIENAMKNQAEYVPAKKECILPFCGSCAESCPKQWFLKALEVGQ